MLLGVALGLVVLGDDAEGARQNVVAARVDRSRVQVGVPNVDEAALRVVAVFLALVLLTGGAVAVVAVPAVAVAVPVTVVVASETQRAQGEQTGGGGCHNNSSLLQHSLHLLIESTDVVRRRPPSRRQRCLGSPR